MGNVQDTETTERQENGIAASGCVIFFISETKQLIPFALESDMPKQIQAMNTVLQ